MINHVTELAATIANQSPVAVQTTKKALVYSRDHTVQESLDHIVSLILIHLKHLIKLLHIFQATLNQFLLQSEDLASAAVAQLTKQTDVVFSKL